MVRLVRWYPDQVAKKWEAIGRMIEASLPPIVSGGDDRMNKVLESILCGRLVVHAVYEPNEESKITFYGVIVTSIVDMVDGTGLSLLIYSIYGTRKVTMEQIREIFSLVRKVAIAEGCNSVTGYTSVPHLVKLCKEDGWNTDFTFVKLEV